MLNIYTSRLPVKLAAVSVTAVVILASCALIPSGSESSGGVGRLSALIAPEPAHAASPISCITLGRNLVGFASSGDPWLALNAARRVPGCGDFNAGAICWASRQWWGGGARYIVRLATWGRYDRC